MKEKTREQKRISVLWKLLLAGSVLAALKCIFVSFQMDEEYAVSMPYRMLLGDRMFTQIWDPHQTSAFVIEFLMWIYLKLFHTTTGVVIWVRIWGTVIHGAIAYGVYRVLKNYLSKEYSFYLAILYFNLSPKGYIMPEFANMLVWSLTLLLLSLFRIGKSGKLSTAVISGVWMCAMVLSYPSAVLLFPVAFFYLWKQKGYGRKAAGIFTGVCLLGGACYLGYLFSYMTPEELLQNISCLLAGNGSHTGNGKLARLAVYSRDLCYELLICAGYGIVTCFVMQVVKRCTRTREWFAALDKKGRRVFTVGLVLTVALFYQIVHWLLMRWRFEYSYSYAFYLLLFGVAFYFVRNAGAIAETAKLWLVSSVVLLVAVLVLTNLNLFTSVRYILPGVVMGIAVLLVYAEKNASEVYRKCSRFLLLFWCFTAIFVKGWEYRHNEGEMRNITCVRGIISEGPAKGILTEYMQSYMQESLYEEMRQYAEPGDKMLILDMGTSSYLYRDVEVASYTTICDPRYNDTLLKYWELNPGKYPDVIVVPCWYGELRWDPESWIMRWIENEYVAEQVIDGMYYRYYVGKKAQ